MLYSARVVSQKDSLGFTVYLRAPFRTPLCYRNLVDPFSILFFFVTGKGGETIKALQVCCSLI